MNTDLVLMGTGSMIMDILPVVMMILLTISFLRKRDTMKKEESALRESIQLLRQAEREEVK